jgi:membrane protein required for colicin V production
MTWLDIVIIIILLLSVFRGAFRGLIREAFGLAGIVLAIYLGLHFMELGVRLFPDLGTETAVRIVSFALVFLAVCILSNLLGKLVHRAVHAVALGLLDRLLGAALGFLEGFAFVGALLFLFSSTRSGAEIIGESLYGVRALEIVSAFIANFFGTKGEELQRMIHRAPRAI